MTKLAALVLLFLCANLTQAQKTSAVIKGIEDEIKTVASDWRCLQDHIDQGTPGPESPLGTKFLFTCRKAEMILSLYVFVGYSEQDAEKSLAFSQRLQINMSKPTSNFGTEGHELRDKYRSWIAFRRANVFSQVTVGPSDRSAKDLPSEDNLVEAMRLFAQIVDREICN